MSPCGCIQQPDPPSTHQEMLKDVLARTQIHKHVQTHGLHRGMPTLNIRNLGLKVVFVTLFSRKQDRKTTPLVPFPAAISSSEGEVEKGGRMYF